MNEDSSPLILLAPELWCKTGLAVSFITQLLKAAQMRAKYQAEISSSEEATFTQPPPPETGIILFATDSSHSGGQRLKISRA